MKKITVCKYGLNGQFLEMFERDQTPEEEAHEKLREEERERHEAWRQQQFKSGCTSALRCDQCGAIFGWVDENGDCNGCLFMCLPCKEVQHARGT